MEGLQKTGGIIVFSSDPGEQRLLGGMLQGMGGSIEQVFNPLDMIQILQRREFDLLVIGGVPSAGRARLMWYAQSFQPWLQGLALGREKPAARPAYMPAEQFAVLAKPFQAGRLRLLVGRALRRKKKKTFLTGPSALSSGLFFLENLRAFLPDLLDYHQSFPLLEYMQKGMAEVVPCHVSGALCLREGAPLLNLCVRRPVGHAFLEEIRKEILAGYSAFVKAGAAGLEMAVEKKEDLPAIAPAGSVSSFLVVPLVTNQQFQGMLLFASPEAGLYAGAENAHICHLANHLARIFPDLSHMQSLVVRDELTGLHNRRSFENELRRAWQICSRYRYPIGLLMMDLDMFKALNDTYGHMIGDAVLKEFARILDGVARKTDVIARYGGDEFAIISSNTNMEQARVLARRLQEAVAQHVFCADRHPLQMGVSIGVAASDYPGINNESDLLLLADRACYLAKDAGGGRIGAADAKNRLETPGAQPAEAPETKQDAAADKGRIFIVDDEEIVCLTVARILAAAGFNVASATDPRAALEQIRPIAGELDVALLDINMPEMNGIEMIRALKAMNPEIVCIVLSGYASVDNTIAAMRAGAYDFMQKPVNFDELTFTIKRGVEHRRLLRQVEDYRKKLEDALDERTRSLNEITRDLENSYLAIMEALAVALKVHEADTVRHGRRVADYAVFLARRMGRDGGQVERIRRAALLHDIGKIGIPDAILQKANALSGPEMEVMRRHAVIGYDIIRNIPFLLEEAEMIYQHHENFDGSGYPRGLAGSDIVFGARLLAVVDTFDALSATRVYREKVSVEEAVREIRRCSGTQFDPEIVRMFLSCYREMPG